MEMIGLSTLIAAGLVGIFVILRHSVILAFFLASFTLLPYVPLGGGTVRSGYLVAVMTCYSLLLIVMYYNSPSKSLRLAPIPMSLILFTLWAYCASALNACLVTRNSLTFLVIWSVILVFFVLAVNVYSRRSARAVEKIGTALLRSIVFCGVLSIVFAIVEQVSPAGVHKLFSARIVGENIWGGRNVVIAGFSIKRVGSFIGSPNAFGAFLIMPMMGSLVLGGRGRYKLGYLTLTLCFLGAQLLLSNSRGALLGFLGAACVFLWREGNRIVLGILVLVGVALITVGGGGEMVNTAYIPSAAADALGVDSPVPAFLVERAYFWKFTLAAAAADIFHLLMGYGVSNQFLAQSVEKTGAHSIIFSSLHFYGVPGLLLVLNVLNKGEQGLRPSARRNGNSPVSETAWYSGAGLLVHSLFDDVLLSNAAVMGIYFLLLVPAVAGTEAAKRQLRYTHYGVSR